MLKDGVSDTTYGTRESSHIGWKLISIGVMLLAVYLKSSNTGYILKPL